MVHFTGFYYVYKQEALVLASVNILHLRQLLDIRILNFLLYLSES